VFVSCTFWWQRDIPNIQYPWHVTTYLSLKTYQTIQFSLYSLWKEVLTSARFLLQFCQMWSRTWCVYAVL
jgi:hypothetical protein